MKFTTAFRLITAAAPGRGWLKFLALFSVALCAGVPGAQAQFSSRWLQDDAYWADGKAEFNLYDAQEVRYGQARPSAVIHIFVREPFSQRELVKAETNSPAGSFPVLKLNQILHVPTGLYVYQQMHSAFWRVDQGALIKATLTSNDSCGNTYKEFRALAGLDAALGAGWSSEWRTYWEGMSAGAEKIRAPEKALFYDELPMRVRTIDFATGHGEFAVPVAGTIIRSKKDDVQFQPARIQWVVEAEAIRVSVKLGTNTDEFVLDPQPPYLLREWKKGDGGSLKLRRSLKIDYWNYNKLGDMERALRIEEGGRSPAEH